MSGDSDNADNSKWFTPQAEAALSATEKNADLTRVMQDASGHDKSLPASALSKKITVFGSSSLLGGNVSHGQSSSIISQEHDVIAVVPDNGETLKAPLEECYNCNEAVKRLLFESEKPYYTISDDDLRKENIKKLNELKEKLGSNSKKSIKDKIGPAHTIAFNRRNGKTYTGINHKKGSIPEESNNYILERMNNLENNEKHILDGYTYTKGAGSHAEIYAVNAALNDDPGAKKDDITVDVIHTGSVKLSDTPFVQCPHCESILRGINCPSGYLPKP
ncbi:YwqJ-related putative deaminase [Acetobacter thailandicus]|uniref:YwqJ-related putative deaminase n=1 Tax=Acetobacter thailandicus TaxID=1502842 RepID=UPI001BA8997C|nr:YwqJ-related putative deaminase [Acetobacter thailandicus]MBS0980488.1 hypothetical protein [Acetobacter thailandicus]